jgi:hypothetical protein
MFLSMAFAFIMPAIINIKAKIGRRIQTY